MMSKTEVTDMTTEDLFRMVEVNDFCTLNRAYEEENLAEGDVVYLCGEGYAPETEDDPYLHRKLYVVARMDGDHVLVDNKPLLIRGNSLEALPEERQEELRAVFMEDHTKPEYEEGEDPGDVSDGEPPCAA